VVTTLGADGAVAFRSSGTSLRVPGVRVDVVDTIGAGDTFSAGLLHSLESQGLLGVEALDRLTDRQLDDALRYAALVSALACTHEGGNPPYAQDVVAVRD
jgi:fructokinase